MLIDADMKGTGPDRPRKHTPDDADCACVACRPEREKCDKCGRRLCRKQFPTPRNKNRTTTRNKTVV